MEHTPIPSLEELKQKRLPIRNVNKELRSKLSRLDNLALWITEHVGTMGFFLLIFVWTVFWLTWNTFGPHRFDPAPAFVLWLFISNMIQIFLMPLIMIGQNLQGQHSEARSEADFEINRKSERETEVILLHLENLEKKIEQLNQKLAATRP